MLVFLLFRNREILVITPLLLSGTREELPKELMILRLVSIILAEMEKALSVFFLIQLKRLLGEALWAYL
jgi:hypothetical protein